MIKTNKKILIGIIIIIGMVVFILNRNYYFGINLSPKYYQQPTPQYVCPDGSVVSDASQCPSITSIPQAFLQARGNPLVNSFVNKCYENIKRDCGFSQKYPECNLLENGLELSEITNGIVHIKNGIIIECVPYNLEPEQESDCERFYKVNQPLSSEFETILKSGFGVSSLPNDYFLINAYCGDDFLIMVDAISNWVRTTPSPI